MIIVNTETIAEHRIVQTLGLVQGSSVRAKFFVRDITASLKSIIGGELRGYTELMNESRQQAIQRMVETAQKMGANAIVNVRFSTSSVMDRASELFCWGTAVVMEKE
jgi:uncharacterized protein YbjQ (UPF0145 family)